MAPVEKTNSADRALQRIRAFQRSSVANKKCADCKELGPTYICLDYMTFVCQVCSGLHREFGHKVKSISLSQWTPAEVERIENGGNEKAARTWLAKWTAEEYPPPDSSEMESVREFIRKVYKEQRWWQEQVESKVAEVPARNDSDPGIEFPVSDVEPPQAQSRCESASGACEDAVNQWETNFEVPVVVPAQAPMLLGDLLSGGDDASNCVGPVEWAADFGGSTNADGLSNNSGDVQTPCTNTSVATGDLAGLDFLMTVPEPPAARSGADMSNKDAESSTMGDQLREAVLSGKNDDVMNLFRQCTMPAAPAALVAPNWTDPFAALVGEQDDLEKLPNSNMAPLAGIQAPSALVAPAPVAPQGVLSQQQLTHMDPQQLMQMQAMISQALMMRSQPETSLEATKLPLLIPDLTGVDEPDVKPETPKQFGDLLHAFHEKNPIVGLQT